MTRGRRDIWRRHGIPRDSKATVAPLDVLHIPRGTINSRPRETTIDLIEISARGFQASPGIQAVRRFSQSLARLGNPGVGCTFETFDFIPRAGKRSEGKRSDLNIGEILCDSKFGGFTINCGLTRRRKCVTPQQQSISIVSSARRAHD